MSFAPPTQKKHAREGELEELEHQDAMPPLWPARRSSLVPGAERASRQPFANPVEGEEQRNKDEHLRQSDSGEHQRAPFTVSRVVKEIAQRAPIFP